MILDKDKLDGIEHITEKTLPVEKFAKASGLPMGLLL